MKLSVSKMNTLPIKVDSVWTPGYKVKQIFQMTIFIICIAYPNIFTLQERKDCDVRKDEKSHVVARFDLMFLVLFPFCFTIFNLIYWSKFMNR